MNKNKKKWIGTILMLPLLILLVATIIFYTGMIIYAFIIEGCWIELGIVLVLALFVIGFYMVTGD